MSFLVTFIVMFCFWVLLSGHLDFLMLGLGAISSLLVARWSHDLFLGQFNFTAGMRRLLRFIVYLPWLFWQIVLANIHVVYLTLHPGLPISPRIVSFEPDLKTDIAVITLANSITLTPGTVTIEGDQDEFIVHAISLESADGLLSGEMQARVREVEGK